MRSSVASISLIAACLFCIAPASAAGVDATDAPPAGIVPVQTTLSAVLRAHETAVAVTGSATQTSREHWTLDEAGRSGTETIERRGDDYHSVLNRQGAREEYGKLGSDAWHRDANGVVTPTDRDDEDSFAMQRVLEDASDPKNDVKLLGKVEDPAAYVLEVKRPFEKHPEWVFVDVKTGYVDRTESIDDGERSISTYDDYRTTDGSVRPWHVEDRFSDSNISYSYRLVDRVAGIAIETDAFKEPSGAFRPSSVTSSEIVPSSIKDGSVVVRLVVNGRGLDFELSAGSPRSYIDRHVALDMNLPTFGQPVKTAKGAPLGFDTVVAEATVGSMHVHDFALRAVDIAYEPSDDTRIVGVLGSDFLHSGLFTIDYVKKEVEVASNDTPSIPESDDAIAVPLRFNNGEPFVSATIAEHEIANARIDNAFPYTTILGSFTSRYPESVPDEHGKARHRENLPFADDKQYGREGTVWYSYVPDLYVAGLRLRQYPVIATDMQPLGNTDAIIGMNYLQYFDVQLDYAHGRMILRKNRFFGESFRAHKH